MELNIKKNTVQVWAICRLNLKASLRFKYDFFIGMVAGFVNLIVPFILFNFIFGTAFQGTNRTIGIYSAANFISLILLGYCGTRFGSFFGIYAGRFRTEKNKYTLPALIIAPFNRLNLLIGIFLAHLIMVIPPFAGIFIFNLFLSPTIPSISTILFLFLIYMLYGLGVSGIGLVLGILVISRENWVSAYRFVYRFITMFNCSTYPKEIFPEILWPIIELNPFYHIFEMSRYLWVYNEIWTLPNLIHMLFIVSTAILAPIIGIILFNKIYKKYGVEGV